jgi:hypothetical protein
MSLMFDFKLCSDTLFYVSSRHSIEHAAEYPEYPYQSFDFKPDPEQLLTSKKPPSWLLHGSVELQNSSSWDTPKFWENSKDDLTEDKRERISAFLDLQSNMDCLVCYFLKSA